jgi:hypothetical protein
MTEIAGDKIPAALAVMPKQRSMDRMKNVIPTFFIYRISFLFDKDILPNLGNRYTKMVGLGGKICNLI